MLCVVIVSVRLRSSFGSRYCWLCGNKVPYIASVPNRQGKAVRVTPAGAASDQPGDNTCSCTADTGCYTVRSGDTFFNIARTCDVQLKDIESLNPQYSGSIDALFPDDVVSKQKLRISRTTTHTALQDT